MSDPKDLLAVLDLPTELQKRRAISPLVQPKPWYHDVYLRGHGVYDQFKDSVCHKCGGENVSTTEECTVPDVYRGSLADLAFRLRPEPSLEYREALKDVCDYLWQKGKIQCGYRAWLEYHITPIDRIIAALKVKEKK